MFIAVLLASVLGALPAVSQTEGSSVTDNTPHSTAVAGEDGVPSHSIFNSDANKEKIPSAIAFTESLRIKANADGTWLIDPRMLADGFLAHTSNGELIRVFLESKTKENGDTVFATKWRQADDPMGSIVISDGEIGVVGSGDGYSECLKFMRLNNFTNFFIEALVLGVRVDRQGQTENRFTVTTSGIAEKDYISLEIPGVVTTTDCADLAYSIEVRLCTFRNGIPCKDAVILGDGNGS
jgi:hypothetical protein